MNDMNRDFTMIRRRIMVVVISIKKIDNTENCHLLSQHKNNGNKET